MHSVYLRCSCAHCLIDIKAPSAIWGHWLNSGSLLYDVLVFVIFFIGQSSRKLIQYYCIMHSSWRSYIILQLVATAWSSAAQGKGEGKGWGEWEEQKGTRARIKRMKRASHKRRTYNPVLLNFVWMDFDAMYLHAFESGPQDLPPSPQPRIPTPP